MAIRMGAKAINARRLAHVRGTRTLTAAIVSLVSLAACATPPIRLAPRFSVGSSRTYALRAAAETTAGAAGITRSERTVLTGRSTIEVLSVQGDEATLRLTLTPTSFTRDGRAVTTPAEQRAELVAGPDGSIRRILTVGGLPVSIAGADIADLAPIVGIALPTSRVRIGRPLPTPTGSAVPAIYQGRVDGVRVIDGYDCAIVELGTRRAIDRQRDIGGQQIRLEGTESAHSRIAFAFRAGFPVEIATDAEGVFDVAQAQGTVTIVTHTTLRLL